MYSNTIMSATAILQGLYNLARDIYYLSTAATDLYAWVEDGKLVWGRRWRESIVRTPRQMESLDNTCIRHKHTIELSI